MDLKISRMEKEEIRGPCRNLVGDEATAPPRQLMRSDRRSGQIMGGTKRSGDN